MSDAEPDAGPEAVLGAVRELWSELLEVPLDTVGLDSNFFMDGGDSLAAVELVVALGDRVRIDVQLDPLFTEGTLSALVDAVLADLAHRA